MKTSKLTRHSIQNLRLLPLVNFDVYFILYNKFDRLQHILMYRLVNIDCEGNVNLWYILWFKYFFLLNIMKIIRKHYINVFVLNLPKKHRCFWLVRLYRQQSPIWYIFFLEFHFLISFWLTTLNLDVLQFHLKPMLGEGEGCFYIRVGRQNR